MKKEKRVLKGIVVTLMLTANVLTSCLGSFNISLAAEKVEVLESKRFNQTEIIKNTNLISNLLNPVSAISSVDLTGLATGTDATHTHIYEKKYDDTKHWEECFICNQKINEIDHALSISGTYGCASGYGYQKEYCTAGCGYNKQLPKQPHEISDWINDSSRNRHYKRCNICSNQTATEQCHNADGELLGCATGILGTCVVCGHEYISTKHTTNIDHGYCYSCGEKIVIGTNSIEKVGEGTSRITWKFKPANSNIEIDMDGFSIGSWSGALPPPTCKLISISKDTNTGEITVIGDLTLTVDNAPQSEDSRLYGKLTMDGDAYNFNLDGTRIYPDNYAPTIISATVTGNGTVDNFSQKAQLTAVFEDTWDSKNNLVYMRLLDKDKSTVISDWGTATRNGTNWTKIFDVVAETREATSIYVQAKDACGNITDLVPVSIQYIDAKAPVLTSSATSDTDWAKSKDITYTATDGGVENISIAFNNQNDFQLGTKNGTSYSRTYTFYGDVYGSVVGALYLKDSLGNITTKKVTISKLDGTAPTITGTSIKNDIITVNAHDQRNGMGEGSGVSSYRYIASNTKLTNPSITTTNSTLVTGKTTGTGTLTVNNIADANYIYVAAVDAVGNIGNAVEVPVPKLTLGNTIDLSAQDGKGGVILTWTIDNSAEKLYSIYQQGEGETTWNLISDKKAGTTLTTSTSKDVAVPNKPTVVVNGIENDKIKISQSAIDNGSTYSFYAEAYDKTNTNVLLSRSNQVTETITTGIKGYYYITDDNEINDFDIANANFVTGEELELDIEHNGKYIHIKAVDNAGNVSQEERALIWIESQATVDPNEGNLEGDENNKILVGLVGKTVDLGTPVRTGYTFLGWSATAGTINGTLYTYALEPGIVTANWEINDYAYRVEYYYNGTKDKQATETGIATYMTKVDNYTSKGKSGYVFDTVQNFPLTITEKEEKNVIRVYYKTNTSTTKPVYYMMLFYKDGNLDINASRTIRKNIQVLLPNKIQVDKNLINPDKYDGYELEKTTPDPVPDVVDSGSVINVYYVSKPSQAIIKYVDKFTGEEIAPVVSIDGKIHSTYDISGNEKEIDGYTLIESPDKTSGTFTKEIEEFTYYYAKNFNVIIRYLEKDTEEILADEEILTKYEGENYETVAKEIENYELVQVPENASGKIEREDIQVTYYYLQKTKVVLNHIDLISGEILETEVIDGKVGDKCQTHSKDISDYVLEEKPEIEEYIMTKEEIEVNYYYTHVSEGVVEKHIDKISGEILENLVYEGNEGDEYVTSPKEFEGYDLDESLLPENSAGIMTKELIEVKYYYVRKASVKVQYLDRNTEQVIAEDVVIDGHEGDEYETSPKEIEDYYLVENMIPENSSGTMTKDEIIVRYYYAQKSAGVIEKHINEKTGEVIEEHAHEGLIGDEYKTSFKEFEGYEIDKEKIPENSQGKMTEELIEVNYYYLRTVIVKVEHIDEITNEIITSEIIKGYEDDSYTTSQKEIKGYILNEEKIPENKDGIMSITKNEDESINSEIVVKYYYTHVSAGVIERHIDIKTDKVIQDELYEGKEGDTYKTTSKKIDGYDLVTTKIPKNKEGIMEKELIEVKYYYIRKASVKVQYVDSRNNKLAEEYIIEGHEGDEYKTSPKEIKDYTLNKDKLPENSEGVMIVERSENPNEEDKTQITVIYYYDKTEKIDGEGTDKDNTGNNNNSDNSNNNSNDNSNNGSNNNSNGNLGNNSNNNTNNNENNGNNNGTTVIIDDDKNNSNNPSNNTNKPVNTYPTTGDMTPIISLIIIGVIVIANIVQIVINKKKKEKQ